MGVTLVLDNYDSFVYNLVQYLGEQGAEPVVRRNDEITLPEIEAMRPGRIVISPGPKTPREAGISNEVVRAWSGRVPVLGVCLGHQCIGDAFGGEVVRADRIMHGKTSQIIHTGYGIFHGLENPFEATRYHSLVVRRESLPDQLLVTAWTSEGEVMGLKHRDHETWGVQFHPESILTREGKGIIRNFLALGAAG